ncbi:MAG: ISAzo13 family transposase [Ktedonobacteraceae bacterium]
MKGVLNERQRRLLVAAEARSIGRGGIAIVERSTGVSRHTIMTGIDEFENADKADDERVRKSGAGRKKLVDEDPSVLKDLESLVEPVTRGDPESPLLWTIKSTYRLAEELVNMGHQIGSTKVGELLRQLGFSLQANKKTMEGSDHEDRNAQFEHINAKAKGFLDAGEPVISVDTKKKELVGPFKNAGRELRPKGEPEEVRVHDFATELGRAAPYGVYDVANNTGWVSVGTDHDTASFAVESIRRWWNMMGRQAFPSATKLFINADGGGSNGSRVKLWKLELQGLADQLGMPISVSHLPPGTSKWNKIEHRMFSHITQNWRGKPLISHEVIVKLIRHTTTRKGLKIKCALDTNQYPTGRKVSPEEMSSINMVPDEFHGEWNYTIHPSWNV